MSQRNRHPETVDYLQDTVGREDHDPSNELVTEIQAALLQLRIDYRTVFILFHEQNQSYEEISLAMDRPVGTVKTWLHRARLEVLDRLRQRGMLPDAELPSDFPVKPYSS